MVLICPLIKLRFVEICHHVLNFFTLFLFFTCVNGSQKVYLVGFIKTPPVAEMTPLAGSNDHNAIRDRMLRKGVPHA